MIYKGDMVVHSTFEVSFNTSTDIEVNEADNLGTKKVACFWDASVSLIRQWTYYTDIWYAFVTNSRIFSNNVWRCL